MMFGPANAGAERGGFELLRAVIAKQPGKTVILSPLSVEAALSLLADGASGTTQMEIQSLVSSGSSAALSRLRQARGPGSGTAVSFGSALWSSPVLHFSSQFARRAQETYLAMVFVSDAVQAPAQLNGWIDRVTHGLIKSILDLPPDPNGLVLANGMAFNGKWRDPFDPAVTRPRPFYAATGAASVPMMTRSGEFQYAELEDGQLVQLPYDDGRYSLWVFLPRAGGQLEDWVAELSLEKWDRFRQQVQSLAGELTLPRMDLAYSTELKPILEQLGVRQAFAPGADFSAMTTERAGVFVSSVMHRTVVKIDEAGTRAAASTTIQMPGSAVPGRPFQMVVDRPFMFAIQESSQGDILFLGLVRSP